MDFYAIGGGGNEKFIIKMHVFIFLKRKIIPLKKKCSPNSENQDHKNKFWWKHHCHEGGGRKIIFQENIHPLICILRLIFFFFLTCFKINLGELYDECEKQVHGRGGRGIKQTAYSTIGN